MAACLEKRTCKKAFKERLASSIDPLLQAENTNGEARSIGYVHTAGLSLPHPLCFQTFTVFTSQGHLALTKTPTSRIHSKMLPSIDIPAFSLILSTHTYWLLLCVYIQVTELRSSTWLFFLHNQLCRQTGTPHLALIMNILLRLVRHFTLLLFS